VIDIEFGGFELEIDQLFYPSSLYDVKLASLLPCGFLKWSAGAWIWASAQFRFRGDGDDMGREQEACVPGRLKRK
jgi:hypothetical protein